MTLNDEGLNRLVRTLHCHLCGAAMDYEEELCSIAGQWTCFPDYHRWIRLVDGDGEADRLVEKWNERRDARES